MPIHQEMRELLIEGDPREFTEFCVLNGIRLHTCGVRKVSTMYSVLLQLSDIPQEIRNKAIVWLQGYRVVLHFDSKNRLESLSSPVWHGPMLIDQKLLESIR